MMARTSTAPNASLDADIIIIGAGLGGLGLARQLRRTGQRSFIVLERAAAEGGTWRDNIYPGCACDIPAMLYSFSFVRYGGWTRTYPRAAELRDYVSRLVRTGHLRDHIRFRSDVSEARFDEGTGSWTVRLRDGTALRSRILISAMGPLNKPNLPTIAGSATFAGSAFHSSAWDDRVDLHGKDVVVIGTGASAIQFVPYVARAAARLSIFQRTAPWVIPRNDRAISRLKRFARNVVPFYAWFVRKAIYWMLEIRALGFVVNPALLERQERTMRKFIERSVPDPTLRAKVTPNYRAGCKRILLSDDYYPALSRPNVEVVSDALTEIRAKSVVTADGREIAADVIVYATGFRATAGIAPVRIFGRDGIELGDTWSAGMQAYLGTTIAGFPNLFLIIGPNTGLGHNSMIFMMEAQYRYIQAALTHLRRARLRALEVRPDVMRQFNERLQERMRGTVWATGCSSWYQDASGKNVSLWPGFTFAFRRQTARFDPSRYVRYPAYAGDPGSKRLGKPCQHSK